MENKNGKQKDGKQFANYVVIGDGKQRNGKQRWKTNNITYLLQK
jgi:hypothetical protein